MAEIQNARQLLQTEQSAFVVFTRGNHFIINSDHTGSTGNWRINSKHRCDKVIIYCRKEENEVYLADFAGIINSSEAGRKVILLHEIHTVGVTLSNWLEFGGRSQSPIQRITYDVTLEE